MYSILEKIGKGAYGTVFKAKNEQSKEIVAVKRIKFKSIEDGIPFTSLKEIGALKVLKHPSIISLIDVIHNEKELVMVLEYCSCDLRKFIKNQKKIIPYSKIISIFKQILLGIQHIHKLGFVHRDIKPSNILINKNFEIKICDFGLSRNIMIPNVVFSLDVITPWYRPPEILLGIKEYNFSIDIWSIACVIVEMIIGEPLFPFDNSNEHLKNIYYIFGIDTLFNLTKISNFELKIKPIGLSSILENYDKGFIDLLEKMFIIDPKFRITADEALKHRIFI